MSFSGPAYKQRNLTNSLFSGSRDLLQHRVHQMPQTRRLLHSPRGSLHPLEADRLLPGRLHHLQEGGGSFRRVPNEAQPKEQAGPRL